MRRALLVLALAAAACDAPKPPAPEPPIPEAGIPMEKDKAEKYIAGLQEQVDRAVAAKAKADAANKKAKEAEKPPE